VDREILVAACHKANLGSDFSHRWVDQVIHHLSKILILDERLLMLPSYSHSLQNRQSHLIFFAENRPSL